MADLSQTITNTLPIMAISRAVYWNALTWGTDNWGRDEDVITETEKGIANTLTHSTAIFEDIEHLLDFGALTVSSSVPKEFIREPITETIDFSADIESLMRSIGIWDYLFTKPTADGEEAVYDVSSKVADVSTDWSSVSEASSTWSDA
jgi:hypothetical protein